MEFILLIFQNKIARNILLVLFFVLILGGLFAYLTHQRNKAIKQAEAEKAERERLEKQNEGLKILANTANIAIEVENEKKIANQQSSNSANANRVYANTRNRDSNQSSNDFNEAKRKFCGEFPTDSFCQ